MSGATVATVGWRVMCLANRAIRGNAREKMKRKEVFVL